jgi:hypothetical protein
MKCENNASISLNAFSAKLVNASVKNQ